MFIEGILVFLSLASARIVFFKALLSDIFSLLLYIDPTLYDGSFFDFGTQYFFRMMKQSFFSNLLLLLLLERQDLLSTYN